MSKTKLVVLDTKTMRASSYVGKTNADIFIINTDETPAEYLKETIEEIRVNATLPESQSNKAPVISNTYAPKPQDVSYQLKPSTDLNKQQEFAKNVVTNLISQLSKEETETSKEPA